MGRRPKNYVPPEGTPEKPTPSTTVRRPRRRRTTPSLFTEGNETQVLVEAVLKSRGAKGATQDALQSVIAWAREIHAEGVELTTLAARPRRQKTQAPTERVSKYELNKALLEGIVAGSITVDLQDDGSLLFLSKSAEAPVAPVVAPVDASDAA